MTLAQALEELDVQKPNACTQAEKVRWLDRLDRTLWNELFCTHEDAAGSFAGYGADTDLQTPLLAPEPYSAVYGCWLAACVDLAEGELARYNNSAALYNRALADYRAAYNRAHAPLSAELAFF